MLLCSEEGLLQTGWKPEWVWLVGQSTTLDCSAVFAVLDIERRVGSCEHD